MNTTADNSDRTQLAIWVIVLTVFALAIGDGLIKKFSVGFSLWQIFFLRSLAVILVLVVFIRYQKTRLRLVPNAIFWSTTRSLMLTVMWVIYYIALPYVSLSIAAAGFYTLPLFITLFAAIFNNERITKNSWLSLLLGFSGVVLILQPRAADFNYYALLPLFSAILYAIAMIITRTRCIQEHPLILSLSLNVMMLLAGCLGSATVFFLSDVADTNTFLTGEWSTVTVDSFGVICLLSASILIGSIGTAFAYQNAPSSIVSIFDFSYVAFAAIIGFILFREVPDSTGWTGMGMIVAAGILIIRSKR